jgi:hypothetical protein
MQKTSNKNNKSTKKLDNTEKKAFFSWKGINKDLKFLLSLKASIK